MAFEGMNFALARPSVALESPMDVAMKGYALQNAQQQGQLQSMQIQQQTNAMQREAEYRQGLMEAGGDPAKIQALLNRTGKFKEGQEYAKSLKDTEAAKVGLQNEYLKLAQNERNELSDMVNSVGAAAAAVSQIKDPAQKWQKWQETLPALAQQYAPTPTDSPRMQQIKANRIAMMQQESRRLMAMQAPDDLDKVLAEHLNDSKTKADWLKEAEQERANARVTGFHPAIGPDGRPGIFQATAGGDVRQVPGLKPIPPAPGGHGAGNSIMPSGSSDDIALAFIQGRRKTPTGRELADPETKAGWLKALQMDPTLNDSTIKLRANAQKEADTGKLGTSNNAIKTVLGHTGHLVDAFLESPDLGAGKGINWLVGKAKEMGPGGNPGLQKVYDLVEAIGPEMSKAYIPGQGTEGERHAWKERINPFRPDPERKASLNTFGEMLITKLNANESQYRKAFKGLSDNVVPPPMQLDEDSYNALKKIEAYSGKPIKGADKWMRRYEQSGGAGSATPTVAVPGALPPQATPKVVSLADVRATAQKYGKTVDQVMKDLASKGIGVQ